MPGLRGRPSWKIEGGRGLGDGFIHDAHTDVHVGVALQAHSSGEAPVLKLADWGGAAHAGTVDARESAVGTRGYMAPEIRKKQFAKRRRMALQGSIDVYAMVRLSP